MRSIRIATDGTGATRAGIEGSVRTNKGPRSAGPFVCVRFPYRASGSGRSWNLTTCGWFSGALERRSVGRGRPQPSSPPPGIGIVDAAFRPFGEEARAVGTRMVTNLPSTRACTLAWAARTSAKGLGRVKTILRVVRAQDSFEQNAARA
jgi:hypothetical protein